MSDMMEMLPRGREPASTYRSLRTCTSYGHQIPWALLLWKSCVCLAAAFAGVLGIAALIDVDARPSGDPAQDRPGAQEVDSARLFQLEGSLEASGVYNLRGEQHPKEMGLSPDMIDFEKAAMPKPSEVPGVFGVPEHSEMSEFLPMTRSPQMEEFPEMSELPQKPELAEILRQALNFSEMSGVTEDEMMKMVIPGIFALPRDANSEVQGLVDGVKKDVLRVTSSMGWNVDLAPFKALTFCQEAGSSPITVVKVQVGDGQIAQLTVVLQDGTPLLQSVEAVLAGDKSCMGMPAIKDATTEIQKFADDVKAEVPARLRQMGWKSFSIEPFKAISYCSQGSHLIVRLAIHCQSMTEVDLQLWLHVQPSLFGKAAKPLISGAEMVKSNHERCVGELVQPLTGLP